MAEENDFEAQRAARIAQNKARMAELGLVEASRALLSSVRGPGITLEAGSEAQPRKKRRIAKEEPDPATLVPTRQSSRIRGEAAPSQQAAAAAAQAEAEAEEALGRTRKGTSRKALTLGDGVAYAAPFTLWSIGVTVWELGEIYRGPWAHRYWSSSGCLFHHAYPVGYRASKVQFGRTYDMVIEAGPTGPIFKVIDQKTGVAFSGESPTKPWTDVCLAHRTGQRISGPLFFGFSDLVTQRAIAGLYTQEELQAALQGERLESAAASAEEKAAREFRSIEGVGEATAMALAFTKELGGAQHRSLEELRVWVQQSEDNQEQLCGWLTNSTELPEATRKWPAWRTRLVPKIVAALAGNAAGGSETKGPKLQRGSARSAAAAAPAVAGGAQLEQAGEEGPTAVVRHAKENWPGNSRPAPAGAQGRGKAGSSKAAASAAAAMPPPTRSRRERKASSKYASEEFWVGE